jgi:hypothetical protein
MDCLIITNESGISFQFNDLVRKGKILIKFEKSGMKSSYSFRNTDFMRLPAAFFNNKGNVEVKVFSGNAIIKKKRITYQTK